MLWSYSPPSTHPLNHLNLSQGIPVYPTFLNGWPSSSRQSSRLGMQPTNRSSPTTYPPPGLHVVRYPGIPFPYHKFFPVPLDAPSNPFNYLSHRSGPSALLDYHRINHQFILLKRRCSCVTITIECNLPRVCWRENSATLVLLWWWWWWWFIPELRMEYIHSPSRGWAGALSFVRWMAPCISVALHIACKCDSWTI